MATPTPTATPAGDEDLPVVKVVLLGGAGVGKSALLRRIVGEPFATDAAATLGCDFRLMDVAAPQQSQSQSQQQQQRLRLQLWDTCGQERWASIVQQYNRNAQGALLCYDVRRRASFAQLGTLLAQLTAAAAPGITVVLVGCKGADEPGAGREVPRAEAARYAASEGLCFLETSALTGRNVDLLVPALLAGRRALLLPRSPPLSPVSASSAARRSVVLLLPGAAAGGVAALAGACAELPLASVAFAAAVANAHCHVTATYAFACRSAAPLAEAVFLLPFRGCAPRSVVVSSAAVTVDGRALRPLSVVRSSDAADGIESDDDDGSGGGRLLHGVEAELLEPGDSAPPLLCLSVSFAAGASSRIAKQQQQQHWQQLNVTVAFSTALRACAEEGGSLLLSVPLPVLPSCSAGIAFGATASGRAEFRAAGGLRVLAAECLDFDHGVRAEVSPSCTAATVVLDRCPLVPGMASIDVASFAVSGIGAAHWTVSPAPMGRLAVAVALANTLPPPPRLTPATPLAPASMPCVPEFFLLLDRSGSMLGAKWNQARRVAQLFLHSLPPGCRFQVIGFGSRSECALTEDASVLYNDDSLLRASVATSRWLADLGGTELLEPLGRALASADSQQLPSGAIVREPRVLIVTDGQVTNPADVVELVRQRRTRARVCTVGVGADVDQQLVADIAAAGMGSCVLVNGAQRMEGPAMRQLARLLGLELSNIRIDWGELRNSPGIIVGSDARSSAFHGDVVGFHAIVPGSLPAAGHKVSFTATLAGEPRQWDVTLTGGPVEGQLCNALTVLAAASAIADPATTPDVTDAIAKVYNVAQSPFALAQEQDHGPEDARKFFPATVTQLGINELRAVTCTPPAHVGSGDHSEGILFKQPTSYRAPGAFSINSTVGAAAAAAGTSSSVVVRGGKKARPKQKSSDCCGGGGSGTSSSAARPAQSRQRTTYVMPGQQPYVKRGEGLRTVLDLLIASQKSAGYWEPCGLLSCGIDIETKSLPAGVQLQHIGLPKAMPPVLWATAVAVALCEGRLWALQPEWFLLVCKARKWISERLMPARDAAPSTSKIVCQAKMWLAQNPPHLPE